MVNSIIMNECLPSFQPLEKDDTQWLDGFWGSNLPSIVQLSGVVDAVNSFQGQQDTLSFSSPGSDSKAITVDFQKLAQSSPLQSLVSTMLVNNAGTVTTNNDDPKKNKDRHSQATHYYYNNTDSGPESLASFANQKCENLTFNDSAASPPIHMMQEPNEQVSGIACLDKSDSVDTRMTTKIVGTMKASQGPSNNNNDASQGGFDFAAFLSKEAEVLASLAMDAASLGVSDASVTVVSSAPSMALAGQENYSAKTDSIHAAAESTINKGDGRFGVTAINHSSAFAAAIISLDDTKPGAAVSASMRVRLSGPGKRVLEPTSDKKCKGPHDHGKLASRFRGVTRHRWTGRYEAHLWDSTVERVRVNNKGRKRGKQVYLGGYSEEVEAARAYDKAAIRFWGVKDAQLNFPPVDYNEEVENIMSMSKEDVVSMLRRSSTGFSRGASRFRGVTKHHMHGKWEARIGRVHGNRYLYLGTFCSEVEAARAYDQAAIKYRGEKAITNFKISDYDGEADAAAENAQQDFELPAAVDDLISSHRDGIAESGPDTSHSGNNNKRICKGLSRPSALE